MCIGCIESTRHLWSHLEHPYGCLQSCSNKIEYKNRLDEIGENGIDDDDVDLDVDIVNGLSADSVGINENTYDVYDSFVRNLADVFENEHSNDAAMPMPIQLLVEEEKEEEEEKRVKPDLSICVGKPVFAMPCGVMLDVCAICLNDVDKMLNITVTTCGHVYHMSCLINSLELSPYCPLCRHQLVDIYDDDDEDEDEDEDEDDDDDDDDDEYEDEPETSWDQDVAAAAAAGAGANVAAAAGAGAGANVDAAADAAAGANVDAAADAAAGANVDAAADAAAGAAAVRRAAFSRAAGSTSSTNDSNEVDDDDYDDDEEDFILPSLLYKGVLFTQEQIFVIESIHHQYKSATPHVDMNVGGVGDKSVAVIIHSIAESKSKNARVCDIMDTVM